MDCAAFQRWFSPYVDGLLAASERATMEEHLTSCARCRRDLDSLKQMLTSLRAMKTAETPNLLPGIHAKLTPQPWWEKAVARFVAPWPESLPWHGLALAGSAALLAILVVIPEYRLKKKLTGDGNTSFQLSQMSSQARQFGGEYRDADRMDVVEPVGQRTNALNEPMELERKSEQFQEAPSLSRQVLKSAASSGADVAAVNDEMVSENLVRPFEMQWRVIDVAAAVSQVCEWVQARQGGCVVMDERHLSISLPATEVPQFLQQFSTPLVGTETIGPTQATGVSLPTVVPISLELVPSE